MSDLIIIGRAERIDILDLELSGVPAKIDTGADLSSIWASKIEEKPDGLYCVFFGPGSTYYTGETVHFSKDYSITRIANSFGQKELRYKVKLRIKVKDKTIRASFTLSDRSLKTYPILLGRKLLSNKFLVDVSQGEALEAEEELKAERLRNDLESIKPERKQS